MATDRLFAQLAMLNFLSDGRERSVSDILNHLQHNTHWGRQQLESTGPSDGGKRNVQNMIKEIRESVEFQTQIECRPDRKNPKKQLYKSTASRVGGQIMSIEEACLVLLAEKFLQAAIPADFVEGGLHELFLTARAQLAENDTIPKPHQKYVRTYLKRIAVSQRGQQLVDNYVPYDVLGSLSRAIIEGKRIECRYRGEKRDLHPFGIVLKSPKIYLLAVTDKRMRKFGSKRIHPNTYVCARLSDVVVSERQNRVPQDFDASRYVDEGRLDVPITKFDGLPSRRFELVLRIFDVKPGGDNLLWDLTEFPLSKSQEIIKEEGTNNVLLTASRMRATHQLVEYIVARLDRVEVVRPAGLRAYVVSRLDAMRDRYKHERST